MVTYQGNDRNQYLDVKIKKVILDSIKDFYLKNKVQLLEEKPLESNW
jgi:hypothetical protein